MFHIVYAPHGVQPLAADFPPNQWLREPESYERFEDAWQQAGEINVREKKLACFVFSTITNQLHFPTGFLPNYPFNEDEKS